MKKIIVLFLAILTIFLFSACGKTEGPTQTTVTETTEDPTVRITFPEGYNCIQIAELLEENKVCSAKDFMTAVCDLDAVRENYSFAKKIKASDEKAFALEGYIFPDTYDFYKGESAAMALSRFLDNTEIKLTDEMYKQAKRIGYTMDEIISLASIIQKEAGIVSEMGKVSSVLHNRIESPDYARLQCDVTINYVNDYINNSPYLDGDTSKYADYYNTYKVIGVPEGAICCPGIDAIKAALYPEDTDYYFFVTDADWNYYYSKTYDEHLAYCREFGLM